MTPAQNEAAPVDETEAAGTYRDETSAAVPRKDIAHMACFATETIGRSAI